MAWATCAVVIAGLHCCRSHSAFVRGWDVSPTLALEAAGRGDGVRGVGVVFGIRIS